MANADSNLSAALQNDFLSVATDAELENFELPDNTFLPYADQVTDDQLFSVTTKTFKLNPLSGEVPDTLSFNGNGRAERDLIYQAYERVTGHDDLDPPQALNRQGEGKAGNDNNFTYNIYGNALHNGLVTYRKSELLGGASLYHMTRRLVTYLQDVEPNSYLGSLAGGRWWLAPDCYHIVVYHGQIQNGPNPAPPSYGAVPISAAHLNTDAIAQDLYGMDRALDSARFDAALFTFHWINIQFYTYKDPTKTEEKDAEKEDHWGLVIRHAGTNEGYYLDSMFSDQDAAEQTHTLQLVQTAINRWLHDSNKPLIGRLQAPANQPVQQNISGKVSWQCGVHTIANVIAFTRCGRLGWHNIPTWKSADGGWEREMVNDIKDSLHSLMGLSHDKTHDKTRILDKKKLSKWTKPATKTGKVHQVKVAQAAQDKEKQKDADAQTMKTDLDSLRQEVSSLKTDLITTLRQELVALILDELRPMLREELQNLNPKGEDVSTSNQAPDMTAREQALDERERALNERERAINREETLNERENILNERENQLKRKLDELEAGEDNNNKKQKTGHEEKQTPTKKPFVPYYTTPGGIVIHNPNVKKKKQDSTTPGTSCTAPSTPGTTTTTTTTPATTVTPSPPGPPAPEKDPDEYVPPKWGTPIAKDQISYIFDPLNDGPSFAVLRYDLWPETGRPPGDENNDYDFIHQYEFDDDDGTPVAVTPKSKVKPKPKPKTEKKTPKKKTAKKKTKTEEEPEPELEPPAEDKPKEEPKDAAADGDTDLVIEVDGENDGEGEGGDDMGEDIIQVVSP